VHRRQGSLRRGPVAIGGGFVLLALVGEWIGHAATWYLTGGVTPGRALSGSLHTYLEPVGGALAVLVLLASWLVWRGMRRLVQLTRSTRSGLGRAWRREALEGSDESPSPSLAVADPLPADAAPARLWVALLVVQLVVYLVQENLEARAVGLAWPGLGVLTAHHGSALLIHAVVALALVAVTVELVERSNARGREAQHAVRLYHALVGRRRRSDLGSLRPTEVAARPPRSRFGSTVLSRPPPALVP
jgi:hypothetical protein